MAHDLMYIELKTGYSDDGPAWIGYVKASKSGKTLYFNDHGGGAFSGKDPTKVDRSAAYAARWVAKTVVAAGLAKRCQIQLAYAIGVAQPVSILVETFGTGTVADEVLEKAVRKTFDLRPTAIIRDLGLQKPIYRQLAAYGHMGREDLGVLWEKTDRAEQLKAACQ